MKLGDLFIKLGLKSQEFEHGINKAKGAMSGLMSVAKNVGGVLAAAFSVRAMVNFFATSVKLANEQIAVENELAAALRANGKEVDINMRRYKRFASEMQSITTIGDETTLSLIRLAESMRSKAPEEAARMAIGLSKALRMDLQTATRAAVLAQNENYIALSRYIPELRTAKTDGEKMAAVQQVIASGMKMATAETETAAGKVQQLRNSWGDFRETIGTVIATNETLLQSLTDLNIAVQMLTTKKFGVTSFLTFLAGGKSWEADKKRFEKTIQMQKAASEGVDEYQNNINKSRNAIVGKSAAEEKHIKTIGELIEETNALRDSLKDYQINQTSEINKTLQQIAANEKLIKSLTELQEVQKRSENRQVGEIAPGQQFSGTLTARKGQYGRKENVWMQDIAALQTGALEFEKLVQYIEDNKIKTAEMLAEIPDDWARFNENLGSLIKDFGTDIVDEFGQAMGRLLATGEFDGDFGLKMLESIGRFVSTLGSMLIALGIGSESFKKLLSSGFLSGGVGAIAAGALLVAAGGAISGYARSRASGSGVSGVGSGMFNQNYNIQQASAGSSQPTLFLKGDNIYMSQQRNIFKRGTIG